MKAPVDARTNVKIDAIVKHVHKLLQLLPNGENHSYIFGNLLEGWALTDLQFSPYFLSVTLAFSLNFTFFSVLKFKFIINIFLFIRFSFKIFPFYFFHGYLYFCCFYFNLIYFPFILSFY